jgi:hypothetical protein
MSLVWTIAALVLSLVVLAGALILDRRPYRPGKPNLVPLMILCLAAALLLARHLLGLVFGSG